MLNGQYFHQLNSSQDLNKQFNLWKVYREEVTLFIIEHIKDIKRTNKLVIIGAGNCNDLILNQLESHFAEVLLTDVDAQSMEQAIERQTSQNTKIKAIDYLGITESGFTIEELDQYDDHKFKNFLEEQVANIDVNHYEAMVAKADVVIVMPIYTQLFFGQVDDYLKSLFRVRKISTEQYQLALQRLLGIMPTVINKFNDILKSYLTLGRRLIVFSDLLEDIPDGDYDQQFIVRNIDIAYERYVESYGMGLGHYGLYNLEESLDLVDAKWFRWPFDHDRVMFVKGEVFGLSTKQ